VPDKTERRMASACGHCGVDVLAATQQCRHRHEHIDLPPIRPVVTRVEIFGGRCGGCGHHYHAEAPASMTAGTPFGPGIRSLMMYLHHSHHVGFERLSRMLRELFGLTISEGANLRTGHRRRLPPLGADLDEARKVIQDKLLTARIIASDETTTRVGVATHWQWVFLSDKAVLHRIAPNRARSVAGKVLGGHKPDVWISDRYSGQQELGHSHQVCLTHVLRDCPARLSCATVLRDAQYAIDCGDTISAPKIRNDLR